jgi:hypothetical protein
LAQTTQHRPPIQARIAVLQALDKVTARVSRIEAPIGETVRFGTLDIVARTCNQRPADEAPDTTAFLQIADTPPDQGRAVVFSGWMWANSPALNALEHAVYDVIVLGCR